MASQAQRQNINRIKAWSRKKARLLKRGERELVPTKVLKELAASGLPKSKRAYQKRFRELMKEAKL
jgi:hypothetical protein